ncbi:MAG TPA: DUF6364 family protein [Tepidisphaeraceae bacterium]|nr:DUF6364 family protein [Tepidisphaeraceae bacterium]
MKKLTLTADPEVIDMAKKLAERRGTSVSAMFSQFVRAMAGQGPSRQGAICPATRRLTGIARAPRRKTDRQLLEDALIHRYVR